MCETLKNTIRRKNSGDLDESKKVVMKDREECVDLPYLYLLTILNDSRVIRRIENIVQSAASTPRTGGEAESHARNTLHALKLPLGEDPSADGRFITLMSEICTLSFLSS